MLGFSLLKNSFQFVEIEKPNGKPVIKRFAKRPAAIPFTNESLINNSAHQTFKKLIDEAIEQYELKGPVMVALDNQLAFVKKFLIDRELRLDQIEEFIVWEYRQIFPEQSLNDYQFVYENISNEFFGDKDAVVSVAFRKDITQAVINLFDNPQIELKHLDLDLFSALNGIKHIYKIDEKDFVVLADIRQDTLKLQFVRKGQFFDFYKITFNSEDNEQSIASFESDETLSRLLNKEIRRKLLEYHLAEEKAVDSLYLFGEKASPDLADYMTISPSREVVLVEPFKMLELDPGIGDFSTNVPLSSEYAICIGSALRSISK